MTRSRVALGAGLLVLALLVAFAGCAGGGPAGNGGDGGGGGGGGDQTVSTAERAAAMDAVSAYKAALPADASGVAALVAFLGSRPEFEAAGVSDTGDTWARFRDGRLAIIINNSDPAPAPVVEAAYERAVVQAKADRYGEPRAERARIYRSMGTAFPNCVPNITSWLTQAGYTLAGGSATIADLKTTSGDGIFYIHGHGGAGSVRAGTAPTYALWTLDEFSDANEAAFDGDLRAGVICYMLADQDADQPAEWHYAVTDKFVTKYMAFGDNSLVLIHGCNGSSASAASFQSACFAKGASLYAGWTNVVVSGDSARASRFVFDRLLGANTYAPKEDPKQRPFDYQRVAEDLHSRGWDTSNTDEGVATFVFTENPAAGDCGILAPSIRFLTVQETNETGESVAKLIIDGMFGEGLDSSSCTVTVGGSPVDVTEFGATSLTCEIPDSGGGAGGDVQVEVSKHKSNKVPLTEWRGQVRYHVQTRDHPFEYHVTYDLHYRGDIHPHRDAPHERPLWPSVALTPVGDSKCTYGCSGSETSNGATVTWLGSGQPPYASSSATDASWRALANVSTYEESANNTARVHLAIHKVDGLVQQVTTPAGVFEAAAPIALVFRWDDIDPEQGAYIDVPLDGSYGVSALSRHGLTTDVQSDAADWVIEWDTIPASDPPDPEVHASGLN